MMNKHEKLLSDLIEIKSYSGEEGDLRDFIGTWFAEKGIEFFEQDGNLLVYLEGMDRTRAFIFNSHMDTVSAGDESLWKYGPWSPTIRGEKMIGLGASDMKSGLAASMLLVERMIDKGRPLVDMWFTYVVNEEVDGSGTASFADWFERDGWVGKYKEMAGIFTEPTGLIKIEHGHRGNLFVVAQTKGDSGHASRPGEIKTHAVREMIKFADVLREEMKTWGEEYVGGLFEPPTVGEVTSIWSGVGLMDNERVGPMSINKFPSVCRATFDVRTVPGFHEVAFKKLKDLAESHGVEVDLYFPDAPAGYTDPDEKIVKVAKSVMGNPGLEVSQGSADLGFLTTKGVNAVIVGPGEKLQAHKVDEYCYPKQILEAINIYEAIVAGWVEARFS